MRACIRIICIISCFDIEGTWRTVYFKLNRFLSCNIISGAKEKSKRLSHSQFSNENDFWKLKKGI